MPSQPIYGPGPGAISSDHIVKPRGVFTGPTYQSGPQPPSAPPGITAIQQQVYPPEYMASGSATSSHGWPVILAQLHSFAGQMARIEEYPAYPGSAISAHAFTSPPEPQGLSAGVMARVEEFSPYPGSVLASHSIAVPVLTSPPTHSLMVSTEPPAFPGSATIGRIYSPIPPIAHPIPGIFARVEEWPAHTGSVASSHGWPLNSFIHPPFVTMARREELPPHMGAVIVASHGWALPPIVTYAYSPLGSPIVNSTRVVGGFNI